MGGAMDPENGLGRRGEPDDPAGALGQGEIGAFDRGGEGIDEEPADQESAGVVPNSEDAGYFDDTGSPIDGLVPGIPVAAIRETVVAREEERFGGIKIGSAFFGWLTGTAMVVLLAAVVTAAGRAGFLTGMDLTADAGQASSSLTGGMTGAIALLAVPLLAYFSGGYVAGRMARFNGIGQGLMVWLWGVITAAAAVVLAAVGGSQFNVLTMLNSFLRLPVSEGQLGTTGIIAAIAVAAISLIGAVLGGLAGVHYHRKVDRVGFTPTEEYYQH